MVVFSLPLGSREVTRSTGLLRHTLYHRTLRKKTSRSRLFPLYTVSGQPLTFLALQDLLVLTGNHWQQLFALQDLTHRERHILNVAIRIEPGNPDISFSRADCLVKLGKTQEALSSYDWGLEINDADPEAWARKVNASWSLAIEITPRLAFRMPCQSTPIT